MIGFQNYVVWIVMICGIALLIVLFIAIRKKRRSSRAVNGNQAILKCSANDNSVSADKGQCNDEPIRFESFPGLSEAEEKRLVEVHDSKLLLRINNAIPGTFQAIANAGAIHSYNQAVQSAGQLFRAIVPKGAMLTESRSMSGAVRGFYRGVDNIRGHANLVAVDGNMGNGLATMGVANAAMGVASMVVGQYYMTQINNRLDAISDDIKQITSFQDNEYKSKVIAMIAEIQKSSTFQMETLENDELRIRELTHLKNLEHECAELLGQANLTLQSFTQKQKIDFETYEKTVTEANRWYHYQQILLEVMGRIGELTYALNLGDVSKNYCYAMYVPFAKQAEEALSMLNEWHISNIKRLEIDTEATRRKRQGVNGFIMGIPALINSDYKYKDISKRTVSMINQQSHAVATLKPDTGLDFFQEDVELVAKNGKLYYLPPAGNEKTV